MCLLIFAHQASSRYPLLVAANRDEFHARATAVADFWPQYPRLLAGKDLEQSGTWMGVTRSGRFAAITNYRDPSRTAPAPRSRGELPLDYLVGDQSPQAYLATVEQRAQDYAGFNLLLGDRSSLWYYSNSSIAANRVPQRLEAGIYGLSNASLDTPWPKVERGKLALQKLVNTGAVNHQALTAVVSDQQLADPEALHLQGLASEMDQLLSAQFIVTESYGTRSSTSLMIDNCGRVNWRELSFGESGSIRQTQEFEFALD